MPLFFHTCFKCEYIGVGGENELDATDLYIHIIGGEHPGFELVNRYGDYPDNYMYTDDEIINVRGGVDNCEPWVRRAYQLAKMRGFI